VESIVFQNLFLILLTALFGGLIARSLKLPPLIGYLAAGIFGSRLLANHLLGIQGLAEIGLILLLFSVGLELSLSRLAHTGAIAVLGAIIQMFLVGTISFIALSFWGISAQSAIALSCGFSLSSTALVVKLLEDKAELDAIHGEIMVGWLLTQDLAVIPIIALLPLLSAGGGEWLPIAGQSLLVSFLLVASVFFLGRLVVPFFVHTIASANSRELLVLASVCLALGTAYLVSLFGLSPALGAFLAGVVISETQENHAIF
jgi:CPA2 family monovalent cation:H+ antiporter-2